MNKIKLIFSSIFLALTVATVGTALAAVPAGAATPEESACQGSGGTWSGSACTQGTRTVPGTIKSVGNIIIFITGAISVLMIIIGGLRYTTSGGDQGSITSAKNTILYAVVGLIVSVIAFAIVNFVLSNLK
jgi:hypothetical protein